MRDDFFLFIVILVSRSCVGLKGQWWQSYKKGFYRKSAEYKRPSVQRMNLCSVSGHVPNTGYWPA